MKNYSTSSFLNKFVITLFLFVGKLLDAETVKVIENGKKTDRDRIFFQTFKDLARFLEWSAGEFQ